MIIRKLLSSSTSQITKLNGFLHCRSHSLFNYTQNFTNSRRILCKNTKFLQSSSFQVLNKTNLSTSPNFSQKKSKYSKDKIAAIEDDDDEELKEFVAKGDKVFIVKLASTRLDGILKAGLQISKNKIEKTFYEDRIRVNSDRPRRKSQLLTEGDEVDLVRCSNSLNPKFIDVSRVTLLEINSKFTKNTNNEDDDYNSSDDEDETKFSLKLERSKNLTIENYKGSREWKGGPGDS